MLNERGSALFFLKNVLGESMTFRGGVAAVVRLDSVIV